MHDTNRVRDLERLYNILNWLASKIGGRRRLADCSGQQEWPSHGIYFFLEDTERRSDSAAHRVVRVGTHALTTTSRTTLWNRLSQHRGVVRTGGGNHRGSIFRLIVGEALANREASAPIESWGKERAATAEVRGAEFEHERRVSDCIRAMPFVWLEVPNRAGGPPLRRMIERNAIALLSDFERYPLDPPSPNWLGRWSPRAKITASGLWNQNHVDEEYDPVFLDEMERLVSEP